ncbi:MAG: glycosyltransferase [Candidatus Peribacteraceae bacterium]
MTDLSIIIPTYKRADILRRCLERLEMQTASDVLEVIVVNDGHDDATAKLCTEHAWKIPVSFFEIEKSQQGVARNRGVKAASAPIVLFIGDDIFLEPNACEKHLAAHRTNNEQQGTRSVAVLGFTTWDPTLETTSAMHWLEKTGWQFGYSKLKRYAHDFIPQKQQHLFTYTSHISLPTDLARAHPFREDMTLYGWEDIEWGLRLAQSNVRLFYEPEAVALHHHRMTFEQSLRRMETLGQSLSLISQTTPELGRLPCGLKLLAYKLAALLPTMGGKHRAAFLRGIKQGTRNEHRTPSNVT